MLSLSSSAGRYNSVESKYAAAGVALAAILVVISVSTFRTFVSNSLVSCVILTSIKSCRLRPHSIAVILCPLTFGLFWGAEAASFCGATKSTHDFARLLKTLKLGRACFSPDHVCRLPLTIGTAAWGNNLKLRCRRSDDIRLVVGALVVAGFVNLFVDALFSWRGFLGVVFWAAGSGGRKTMIEKKQSK